MLFSDWGISGLSCNGLDSSTPIRLAKTWLGFLRGMWLERWTAALIEQTDSTLGVAYNVKAYRGARDFELDVVALRGHRVYVLSCSTDRYPGLCKTKAFEAAFRAQQLGGGLARSAFAGFLGAADPRHQALVQQDVAESWGSTTSPHIFGLDDLRAWHQGNLASLKAWLAS
ncbi:MAG: hypothetical protein BWY76_02406 [bacterium ADurb.Bin429]|nr:MAG: hypothetical protein BWY76_02406 [bacterium ADurb.Bin429]